MYRKTVYIFVAITSLILFFIPSLGKAQVGKLNPVKAGYVYPAGGERGTKIEVWVGGRGVSRALGATFSDGSTTNFGTNKTSSGLVPMPQTHTVTPDMPGVVSGDIVARVIDTFQGNPNLDGRDRYVVRERIAAAATSLIADIPDDQNTSDQKVFADIVSKIPKVTKPVVPPDEIELPFVWPRTPTLRKVSEPDVPVSFDDIKRILYNYFGPPGNRRMIDVLNETVVLEVTIAPDAEPGYRELRIITSNGLSNPMPFFVGVYPEVNELEPNSPETHAFAQLLLQLEQPIYETPVVINGQIVQGDVDRFVFRAKKGETLVLSVQARRLMPFLADAVPGWFQPVITLYDENNREIGYADGYRFHHDPLLTLTPPEDGIYRVEIHDTVFRGREDFTYRLTIAPQPLVERQSLLGFQEGTEAVLKWDGKNLPLSEISVSTSPGENPIREITMLGDKPLPIPIRYAVNRLPEINAAENHQTRETAQNVPFPVVINGTIKRRGQQDFYRFEGRQGEQVALTVDARKLLSPIDARLALLDADGNIVAKNDDGDRIDDAKKYLSGIIGTQTHNADPSMLVTLPRDGVYDVRVDDAGCQYGPEYQYRLLLSTPQPDFDLYCTPSVQLMFSNVYQPIWFYADRKEGYVGPIEIRLSGDAQGFSLEGGTIPSGETGVIAALKTPNLPVGQAFALRFEATGEHETRRPVWVVDDMEQAFLYHHRVPAKDLWAFLQWRLTNPEFRLVESTPLPVLLRPGETAELVWETTNWVPSPLYARLIEPIPGVSVTIKSLDADGRENNGKKKLVLEFKVEQKIPRKPTAGNFVVFLEQEDRNRRRSPISGLLPIPFRIEPEAADENPRSNAPFQGEKRYVDTID